MCHWGILSNFLYFLIDLVNKGNIYSNYNINCTGIQVVVVIVVAASAAAAAAVAIAAAAAAAAAVVVVVVGGGGGGGGGGAAVVDFREAMLTFIRHGCVHGVGPNWVTS